MKKVIFLFLLILFAVGCTPGPNSFEVTKVVVEKPAGFLLGLWHGCISIVTFVISLFSDKINVYEVYNNGNWYNFGFMLGISIAFGGGSSGACRSRK